MEYQGAGSKSRLVNVEADGAFFLCVNPGAIWEGQP